METKIGQIESELSKTKAVLNIIFDRFKYPPAVFQSVMDERWWRMTDFTKRQLFMNIDEIIKLKSELTGGGK